ncbi:MAG: diguanylate cyclase [Alphaproteobacteria bacterium]|nr:diguanylate cyclase [Alphaproteobacteria bacterium]
MGMEQLRQHIAEQPIEAAEIHSSRSGDAAVQERLQDFAASMEGWFWETDAELRFTYFSPSVFDITGVRAEWHYGKTRGDLGIPESVTTEAWTAHLQCLQRREPFTGFVFQRRGPDGVKWMRTSGIPVFDGQGQFQGYRGTASVITAEVEARHRNESLISAIENLGEMFALWGPDDRLVVCNRRFRELNAKIPAGHEPGILFEEHLRMAVAAGLFPDSTGREEACIQDRLQRHQNPGAPFEMQRQDGRWILLTEQRLPDGSIATTSSDISKNKRAEQAMTEQNDILDTALSTIPDGLQVLDKDLNLVAWNDRLFQLLNLDQASILSAENPGEALRHALAQLQENGSIDIQASIDAQIATAHNAEPFQHEQKLPDGKWIEYRVRPTAGGGYLTVYRDIDESKQLYERLELLASTDALTKVANRRSFLDTAETEFARAKRYDRDFSFLMIDVDHFKAANDEHGHAAGDDVLRQLATACARTLRESDILGRIGGEEFAALLPETGAKTAHLVAERLRQAVASLIIKTKTGPLSITVSVGITTTSQSTDSVEAIMAEADDALYQAKNQGRNRVVQFNAPI